MIHQDNTSKNLDRLFKTSKITLTEFGFRSQANKLNIKTYEDDHRIMTIKQLNKLTPLKLNKYNTIPTITNKKDIKGNRIYDVLIFDNSGLRKVFNNQIKTSKGFEYAKLK